MLGKTSRAVKHPAITWGVTAGEAEGVIAPLRDRTAELEKQLK